MSTPSTKILDHIVHLTPPGSVEETSEQFRRLGFKVVPGGTHADGLTANALVVLQDGVYLELISFTKPVSAYPPSSPEREKRESHYWAPKHPGWIDYAFLGASGSTPSISEIINERARREGSGVQYLPEKDGGRERPDGRVLKWVITGLEKKHGRGTAPFFCGDVTPREWRVPVDPPSNTDHPCTALGVAHIRILAESDTFITLSRQLTSVVGTQPVTSTASESIWNLETVRTVSGQEHEGPKLVLSSPKDDVERDALKLKGSGIYEVAFWVEKGTPGSAKTPYGKIVWSP